MNNAGGLLDRHLVEDMPDEGYERVMELNMGSTFRVSRERHPHHEESGSGCDHQHGFIAARNGGSDGATLTRPPKPLLPP